MARSRKTGPARTGRKTTTVARTSWRARLAAMRPDFTARGLGRLAARSLVAGAVVAALAAFAHWSATGFLQPGGLDRLVAMKNTPEQAREADAKRGGLDRGRLRSVIAGTSGPGGR